MLPIECLFHIEGLTLVDAIMNNYEYPEDKYNNENKHYYGGLNKKNELEGFISENENDNKENENKNDSEEEYYKPGETQLFNNNKNTAEKSGKKKKKLKKKEENEDKNDDNNENNDDENEDEEEKDRIKWNKDMDKILIDYYFDKINEDKSNINEIINDLINEQLKEFNLDIKKNDIKYRLHKLKVKKGKKRAMKKYNKIHHISNSMDIDSENEHKDKEEKHKHKHKHNKNNNDSISNYIYKLSDKSQEIEFKMQLNKCFESIKDQLISYKKKIDILGDTNNNDIKCELIPTSKEEMNILKDEDLKNLLFSVGFYYNNDTEYITLKSDKINDIDLINENIDLYKNIINENAEQDKDNESKRKEKKEKYTEMQKKRHNNSKKLKDYIMSEEDVKKEREKENGENEINDNSSENLTIKKNNNKKKKKLLKKVNNDLDSIQEEDKDIKSPENSENKKDINDEDIDIKENN